MSRALTLAKAIGADGQLNTADVAGLGALATKNTVAAGDVDSGVAVANLGYTPVNKAGDTMTGQLAVHGGTEWNVRQRRATNTTTNRTHFLSQTAGGTIASPTAVVQNQNIGGIGAGAYDGADYTWGWNGGAELTAMATQNWTPSAKGAEWVVLTTQNGSTSISETLRFSNGGGIKFPAAQIANSDPNALDDYEEGTWTPNIYGSVTAGTQSGTRTGTYVKIGRYVYLTVYLTSFTLSGANGNIYLGGLPFDFVPTSTSGVSTYLEGIDPIYNNLPDNNITLCVKGFTSGSLAFVPSVSNGWDSYMTSSTTWTGGGGSTYGSIVISGITST